VTFYMVEYFSSKEVFEIVKVTISRVDAIVVWDEITQDGIEARITAHKLPEGQRPRWADK
jgi:hypothetical protein